MDTHTAVRTSTRATTLADLLERVLDKGIVIAGDIRINLVEVELLTIQIRLVVCSVDKAREMGMDWWVNNPAFHGRLAAASPDGALADVEKRLVALEAAARTPASPR